MSARYWLSITTYENFQIDLSNEFALVGYPEELLRRALRLQPGDRLVHYIKRLGLFAALGEVRGRLYIDWTPIWPGESYPCRLEHRPLLVLPRPAMVVARELAQRLSFACPPRADLREMAPEDFEVIDREMRRRAEDARG